jgi:hypothetical protein
MEGMGRVANWQNILFILIVQWEGIATKEGNEDCGGGTHSQSRRVVVRCR